MVEFTHIQDEKAQMVDISGKGDVVREAVAPVKYTYGRSPSPQYVRELW